MWKTTQKILMLVFSILCLVGCGQKDSPVEDFSEGFQNNGDGTTLGYFSHGYKDWNDNGILEFIYDGNDLIVPYYVENMDENLISKVGLLAFVNGIPQPYIVERTDVSDKAENTKATFLYKFELNTLERAEFNIKIKPVNGSIGDKVGVYIGTIFNPDYIASIENGIYGNYHELSATIPQSVKFEESSSNTASLNTIDQLSEIPEEIKLENLNGSSDDSQSTLQIAYALEKDQAQIIKTSKGKATIKFRAFGGVSSTYVFSAFVNHQPVKMNGYDAVTVSMQEGKMFEYELNIDMRDYGELNSFYIIAIPAGESYMKNFVHPAKAESILIIHEED